MLYTHYLYICNINIVESGTLDRYALIYNTHYPILLMYFIDDLTCCLCIFTTDDARTTFENSVSYE